MVSPNGTTQVSPVEPTTYTITATGPGGASDPVSVTVTVLTSQPTVTLTATPTTITRGQSTRLTWTSNVASCIIDPGHNTVGPNGYAIVTPDNDITYTITATNSMGTATATCPITVIQIVQPTVSISADPPAVLSGGATTLTWRSTNALTCSVQPGGFSGRSGSTPPLTLTQPTTYTITATGPGGTATGSVTVYIIKPGAITITSPLASDNIKRPDTLVRGTIVTADLLTGNLPGNDIGVTVNGVVAQVYGNQFAANHVPLSQGDNTITATAISSDDYIATNAVTVSADTSARHISLTSNLEWGIMQPGITPLDFTLTLVKSYTNPGYSFTYEGPSAVINTGDDGTLMQFNRSITVPGLYFITAIDNEIVDPVTTVQHTDTVAIMAESLTVFDTKLKGKWGGMKSGFANADITQALKLYSSFSIDKYRTILTAIPDKLPTIAADMQNIELIIVDDKIAKYRIIRMDTFNGQILPITYYIYFIKDINGLWKIDKW